MPSHEDFAMASGEMSEAQFTGFLETVFERLASVSVNGAIHFIWHCQTNWVGPVESTIENF